MKKVKFTGKLSLNKETVTKLNDAQMNNVKGGELWSFGACTRQCTGTQVCCSLTIDTFTL